jgi:chaperonin GroES
MEKFTPIFDRVLVRPDKESEMSDGGIIIPDQAKEKPVQGIILAAGRKCEELWPGAVVVYGKYAGSPVAVDGEVLIILREEEILGFRGERPIPLPVPVGGNRNVPSAQALAA